IHITGDLGREASNFVHIVNRDPRIRLENPEISRTPTTFYIHRFIIYVEEEERQLHQLLGNICSVAKIMKVFLPGNGPSLDAIFKAYQWPCLTSIDSGLEFLIQKKE